MKKKNKPLWKKNKPLWKKQTPPSKKKKKQKKKPSRKKTCQKNAKKHNPLQKNSASWKTTFLFSCWSKGSAGTHFTTARGESFFAHAEQEGFELRWKGKGPETQQWLWQPMQKCKHSKKHKYTFTILVFRDSTIARRHVCISIVRKTLRKPLIFRWVCQRTNPRLSKEGKTIACKIDTKRSEINSNDCGSFWNYLVEFESNFFVAGMNNFWAIRLFLCLGFLCCVLWPVFTRGQTHSTDTAQHRYTQHSHIKAYLKKSGCVLDGSWKHVYVFDNSTNGPARAIVTFSLVVVIRRWSSAQEFSIDLFQSVQGIQRIEKNVGIKDMRESERREWKNSMLRVVEGGRMSGCLVSLCLFVSCCWFLVFLSIYSSLRSFTSLCFFFVF